MYWLSREWIYLAEPFANASLSRKQAVETRPVPIILDSMVSSRPHVIISLSLVKYVQYCRDVVVCLCCHQSRNSLRRQ